MISSRQIIKQYLSDSSRSTFKLIKPSDHRADFLMAKLLWVRSKISEKNTSGQCWGSGSGSSVFFFPLKECVHISRCFGLVHLSSKSPCLEPEHTQTESSSHRETKVLTLSMISRKRPKGRREQFIKTWTRRRAKAPISLVFNDWAQVIMSALDRQGGGSLAWRDSTWWGEMTRSIVLGCLSCAKWGSSNACWFS